MRLRHAVIDDAFDAALVRAAAKSWPAPDWPNWHAVYASEHQRKRACNRWEDMPEPCRRLLGEMLFLDVSPFGTLVPDMGLWGGGMHDMGRGDEVGLHLDADAHRLTGLARRLNAILFLSPVWQEWGGQLELWNAQKTRPVARLSPVPGRLVLFACGDDTWHAVTPLTCPPDVRRMTLACWWYGPPASGARSRAQFS